MSWVRIPPPVVIDTPAKAHAWVACYANSENTVWAADTETDGLKLYGPERCNMRCFSLSNGTERFYIDHSVAGIFKDFLEGHRTHLVFHNIKFDEPVLKNRGIHLSTAKLDDSMLLKYASDPDPPMALDELASKRYGIPKVSYKKKFGKDNIWTVDVDKLADYASLDAFATHVLYQDLVKTTPQSLQEIYRDTMMPFSRHLMLMEQRGIMVDKPLACAIDSALESEINKRTARINSLVGYQINPNSTKQLREYFFGKLGRTPLKMTKGGMSSTPQPSTDVSVLKEWASKGCEVSQLVLAQRTDIKTRSTYIGPILGLPEGYDTIHPSIRQFGSRTGRIAMSDPNLMNLPYLYFIRNMYRARPGYRFIGADYGQLEIRITAHQSKDKNLIQAIREGRDVHSWAAALMSSVPYERIQAAKEKDDHMLPLNDVEKGYLKWRKVAKTFGFLTIYGGGPQKAAAQFGCSIDEAKRYQKSYFGAFPGIPRMTARAAKLATKTGYAETILGRRRYIPELQSQNQEIRASGERIAGNTPIQGSAADIVCLAMLKLAKELPEAAQLIQVHDEILFEVPEGIAEEMMPEIKRVMENPGIELAVPLVADPKIGMTYGEVK